MPTESGLTLGRGSSLGDTADSHGKLKLGSSAIFPTRLKQELLFWEAAGPLPKNLKVPHQHSLETHTEIRNAKGKYVTQPGLEEGVQGRFQGEDES